MPGKVGQHLLEPRALSWSVQSTQRAQKWGRTHRGGSRPAAHPRRSRFQEGPVKGLHILTRPCEEEKPSPSAARTCPWEGAPTGLSWSPGCWPLSPGSMLEPGLVSCPLLPDLPSLFPAILLFLLLLSEGRDKHSPISMLTEEVTLSIFFGTLLAFAALFWPWASPNPGCSLPHGQTPKTIQGPVTKTPEPLFR